MIVIDTFTGIVAITLKLTLSRRARYNSGSPPITFTDGVKTFSTYGPVTQPNDVWKIQADLNPGVQVGNVFTTPIVPVATTNVDLFWATIPDGGSVDVEYNDELMQSFGVMAFPRAVYSSTPAAFDLNANEVMGWRGFLIHIQVFAIDSPAEVIALLLSTKSGQLLLNTGATAGQQFGGVIQDEQMVYCGGGQTSTGREIVFNNNLIMEGGLRIQPFHVIGGRPTEYAISLLPFKGRD